MHHIHAIQQVIYSFLTYYIQCREQKCMRSQKYASENGLPILKNVLLPKTKGFYACLENLKDSLDAGSFFVFLACTLLSFFLCNELFYFEAISIEGHNMG